MGTQVIKAALSTKSADQKVLLPGLPQNEDELLKACPLGTQTVSEEAQNQFIALVGAILRLQSILASYNDLLTTDPD